MADTISLSEAQRRAQECARRLPGPEAAPLSEAVGRYLARDVHADGPWPSTDRSAMDGFGVATDGAGTPEGGRYAVIGEALAGCPFDGRVAVGEAVRIMTGAVVPPGVDTVVKVEDTGGYGGAEVVVSAGVSPGANIRPQGSEMAPGELLMATGRRIHAAEVGALAVLGIESVPVAPRPRVAIVPTGDEVVSIGATPAPHQVRDSNSWALSAKAAECGAVVERFDAVPDDAAALRSALERGLEADVLVTIGGVSKGTHDLVHGSLRELGVEEVFHGIALKPGKPTWCGRRARGGRVTLVFGLPGNPASAFATFDLLVAPVLAILQGGVPPVARSVPFRGVEWRPNRREQAIPARLDGEGAAALGRPRASGDPFSLLDGSYHALVPGEVAPGDADRIRLWPYSSTALGATDE